MPKKNGTPRPLGLPTWSDKLRQEGIRSILEADEEPPCRAPSQGGRPRRGGHPAGRDGRPHRRATTWWIEGARGACFERREPAVLGNLLRERFHDHRLLRLRGERLKAGSLEPWPVTATSSGVPPGGVVSPLVSHLGLARLDPYVDTPLIPADTHGPRRRTHPPYVARTKQAFAARQPGHWPRARRRRPQAPRLPSRAPNAPTCRRLWSVSDADDRLLGRTGTTRDARAIKPALATFRRHARHVELHAEKTLVTHAREDHATGLGDEGHVLQANRTHDHRRPRGRHGSLGLRVPTPVLPANRATSRRRGQPPPRPQRRLDAAYSLGAQDPAAGRGLVPDARMADNLPGLQGLTPTMEVSLVPTFARKSRPTCRTIDHRDGARLATADGAYKGLRVTIARDPPKTPLTTPVGGVSVPWHTWGGMNEAPTTPLWSGRSAVGDCLLAHTCERCGSHAHIEGHHVRNLAELAAQGRTKPPTWQRRMAAGGRTSLVVCRRGHARIPYGRYEGPSLRRPGYRRAS